MKSLRPVQTLFAVAALYDGLLGLAFLLAGPAIFTHFSIEPPNHWGYLHFPAGLLIVFALMFLAIARRPFANRNLIPYGILLKLCYIATALWHWQATGIPTLWKPFVPLDLLFALLFLWSYRQIPTATTSSQDSPSRPGDPARQR